jgi:hypothetical protein
MLAAGHHDRLLTVGSTGDDLDVVLELQHGDEPLAHHGVIVGDEHTDHGAIIGACRSPAAARR